MMVFLKMMKREGHEYGNSDNYINNGWNSKKLHGVKDFKFQNFIYLQSNLSLDYMTPKNTYINSTKLYD